MKNKRIRHPFGYNSYQQGNNSTRAIHQKHLLNAYKDKKNRVFALILIYVRHN